MEFMKEVYDTLGMSYVMGLSTRPKKASGIETEEGRALWDYAENALAEALDEFCGKGRWKVNPGDGAFYGPKVDIQVFDVLKRGHQCATIQVDFQMPRKFNLRFRTADNADGDDKKKVKTEKKAGNGKKGKSAEAAAAKLAMMKLTDDDGGCCDPEAKPDDITWEKPLPTGYERPVMVS